MRPRRAPERWLDRWLKRAGSLTAAAATALSATAHAQAPVIPPKMLPEEGFLPARRHEIMAGLLQSFALQGGELRFRAGVGLDVAPWVPRDAQLLRVSLYGAALLGTWSDGAAFRPLGEGGLRARLSLFPSDALDGYGVIGGGVIGGGDGNARLGLRTSQGLGLRLFRALSTEITADYLFALDQPFLSAGQPYRSAFGISTAVSFDFCSLGTLCDHPPILQQRDDRTCCVYEEARTLCDGARRATAGDELCAAARAALNPREHAVNPGEDPFDRFLGAILEELRRAAPPDAPPPPAAMPGILAELERLRADHRRMMQWRAAGRVQERFAARRRRVVQRKRVYSPYATDLLRALGCGWEEAGEEAGKEAAAGGQACQDVCDAPHPGADACAAAR